MAELLAGVRDFVFTAACVTGLAVTMLGCGKRLIQ